MLTTSELFEFFDDADLLVDAVWNSALRVQVDFRGDYREVIGVAITAPTAALPKEALPLVAQGDRLDIGADSYVVAQPPMRPDHDDQMYLILQRQ